MAKRFLSNIRINDAYTFPASDGTNNQVIKTDGSGNLSFGQLATDSASVMYKDTFTGDGSTTGFTLANALNDEVQSNIYIDGVYQSKGTYSVSGTTVTFSTAPLSGHEIEVISTTGINSGPTAIYTDTFTANGSATAFTLGQTVHSENQTIVFLNGVYQFKGTYALSGTTLTLDTAPSNGVSIEVMSIGSAYSGGDILYDHDFTSAGLMTSDGSGVYSITANNSANWNTAYGWGDHGLSAQDKTDIGNLSGTNTGDQDLSSYATQSYVGTQISNLVDSSPATLDTLNELAAALGDDPNFATTTANSIGTKLPLAGGTMTGELINTSTAGITANSTSHAYLTVNSSAATTASWVNYEQGGTTRWLAGVEGSETKWQLYSSGTKFSVDTSGNATFAGDVTLDNILLTPATIPGANTPSINLRDTNNEIYIQSGSAHIFNFIRYDNRNSMMNIESTGISVTGGGTFTGKVLLNASNINFESSYSGNGLVLSHHGVGPSNAIVSGDASNPDTLFINNGGATSDWTNVVIGGNLNTNTVQISNGNSYNENIRMFPGSNDYSSLILGAVSGTSGTGTGQWSLVRYPNANSNKFSIRHNTTNVIEMTTGGVTTFAGDIMPAAENLYDIGSASVRWEDIWADQVYGRSVYVDEYIYHNGETTNNISFTTGNFNLTVGGNLKFNVDANNTYFPQNNVIISSGNVGIKNTSPNATLEIGTPSGVAGSAGSVNRLFIAPFSNTGGPYKFIARTVSGASDFLDMYYGSNHIISYGLDGKVGIGTDSPSEKLEVSGVIKSISTGAAKLILNGDTNNSGDTGEVDGIIDFLGDGNPGIYGYRINTENWSGQTALHFQEYLNGSYTSRLKIDKDGNVGIGTTAPFSKLHVGNKTFDGTYGMYNNARVGMSNHGELTGLMLASTYNNNAHPEYGLVFVQGPSTSSYNVWSISPDGPAKGTGLNFHYQAQSTNVHSPGNRVAGFTQHGLTFNQDTAAANALDDYEEGTFTVRLQGSGGQAAHSIQAGFYTKIGNVVTCTGTYTWNSGGSNANITTKLEGFPFVSANVSNNRATGSLGAVNGIAQGATLRLVIDPGHAGPYIIQQNSNNYTHNNTIAASGAIYGFSITYRTS